MAKDFGKSPATKRFDEVAKSTMANTNVAVIKLIENSALIDYPENGEDISYTADIENSINELGFTDPIEVTDFKMADGKYMIVSGHRRRAAGVKCGMDLFPCIIKSFENENDVRNYILLSNSQRDSAKDPLLYCNRFKKHEAHLKAINFQGSIREEIAKRLGISVRQADRYNQMNKIILPVWDLVREDIVGMSNILPMSILSHEEQQEIFEILKKYIDGGIELTREKVKDIIEDYKNKNLINDYNKNDSESPSSELDISEPNEDFRENPDIHEKKYRGNQKSGSSSLRAIKNFNDTLNEVFIFKDKEEAETLLNEVEEALALIIGKCYFIGKKYDLDDEVQKVMKNIKEMIENVE